MRPSRHTAPRAILTATVLLLFAAALQAGEYVVPAVAEAPGTAGSYWDTTVEISNLTDAPNRVDLTFYASRNGPTGTLSVTLQPDETLTLGGELGPGLLPSRQSGKTYQR
jgi:hypothetical protein